MARLLFVAMPDSVHTARWIRQLDGEGHEIHLFASTASPRLHPLLHGRVVFHQCISSRESGPRARAWPAHFPGLAHYANGVVAERLPEERSRRLRRLLRSLRPHLVHSLEMQAAGYLCSQLRLQGEFPPWAISIWGSDLFYFGRFPEHHQRLRQALSACDYLWLDCRRDLALASGFGFRGELVGTVSGQGGLAWSRVSPWRAQPPSRRRTVVLKGYQSWAGRALVGLRAFELAAAALRPFELVIFQAAPEVMQKARLLEVEHGLRVTCVGDQDHDSMLRLHARARFSLGLSISDGPSNSMLEAMAMGSLPIQSFTACAEEWVIDGQSALLVPPEDPEPVARAVERALGDDALVDEAAHWNARVIAERLDEVHIVPQVRDFYRRFSSTGSRGF